MSSLNNKIDFAVIIAVTKCNPNGDPLIENRPRTDYNAFGEISDVCLKRKIRNRLQQGGESIFVQSQDSSDDGYNSLSERFKGEIKSKNQKESAELACAKWLDVRSFGQVFAFKNVDTKGDSLPIRGPVSIQTAVSVEPIVISSMQITKSVNSESKEGKSSDTMGTKHRVEFGLYKTFGSINVELAKKTGFSNDDALKIKEALKTLFRDDESSARPSGSMEVVKVIWWEHNCASGQYSSAKVHKLVEINKKVDGVAIKLSDYEIKVKELPGLKAEIIDGE